MKTLIVSTLLLLAFNFSIKYSYAQQHAAFYKTQIIHINGKTITLKPVSSSTATQYSFRSSMHDVKPVTIKKKKGVTKLKLSNGSFVTLKDKGVGTDNPDQESYQLLGQIMDKFYIVLAKYYESGEYLLINKYDGTELKIWGELYISPDGLHIASFSGYLDYDEMPTGIQLFEIKGGKILLDWEYELKDWQPNKIAWKNNNTLVVLKVIPEFMSPSKHEVKSYLELSF
ncbi:hypothetical protein [uncultured Mucilaginibacter sp.]|uniref:hypothetical protein n=1 Tax=uncultured Mucilaginibacter sp. TaxID=797541 RepID=UPI0025CE4AFE|nr:hypothetical protein [uncultured Mucilaginibacter sp.]